MATDAPIHPAMAVVGKMYECFGKGDMATLKTDVFAPDITWALPGHHPLSGVKNGPGRGHRVLRRADADRHQGGQRHVRHDG